MDNEDFKDLYHGELSKLDAALDELHACLLDLNTIQDDYNIPEPEWMSTVKHWVEKTTNELDAL